MSSLMSKCFLMLIWTTIQVTWLPKFLFLPLLRQYNLALLILSSPHTCQSLSHILLHKLIQISFYPCHLFLLLLILMVTYLMQFHLFVHLISVTLLLHQLLLFLHKNLQLIMVLVYYLMSSHIHIQFNESNG